MKLEVRDSPIHGQGCFATELIKRGDKIGVMRGVPAKRDGTYVLWTDKQAFSIRCKLRYMNHSDKPNAAVYDNLEVYALKRIEPGEEITWDYGKDFRDWLRAVV